MSTYDTLSLQAAQGKILFRVWDDTCSSPLIWTGESDTSGFKSIHPIIGSYTPSDYAKATVKLLMTQDQANRSMWDSLLYYTMFSNREHFVAELNDTYLQKRLTTLAVLPTGLSPDVWIHAYRDLAASIHHIEDILIRNPAATVHLTVLRRVTGGLESWTEIAPHLLKALHRRDDRRLKTAIQKAIDAARLGGDHMFYGRIFPSTIVEELVWTRTKVPFELPCSPNTGQAPLPIKPVRAPVTYGKRWSTQNKRLDELRLQKLQKEDKAARFQAILRSENPGEWSGWMIEYLGRDTHHGRETGTAKTG